MARYCPECGSGVTPAMYLCPRCSSPLPGAAQPAAHQPAQLAAHGGAWGSAPPSFAAGSYGVAGVAPTWTAAELLRAQRVPDYRRAPAWRRLVASVIDVVVGGSMMIPGGIVIALGDMAGNEGIMAVGGVVTGLGALAGLWYLLTRDGREGHSLGKEAMGLRVVNIAENRPANARESVIRTLLLPLLGWTVEPVMALLAKKGRRVGDRLAETQVVREEEFQGAPRLPEGR